LVHLFNSRKLWPTSIQAGFEEMNQGLLASYTMPEEGRTHRQEPEPEDDDSGLVMF